MRTKMSSGPDRTDSSQSHASHATVDSRPSPSPSPLLLLHSPPSPSPKHHPPILNPYPSTTSDQSGTDTSPQPSAPPTMEDGDGGTPTPPATAPPASRPARTTYKPSMPVREDCWSEDATYTLIEAWGHRYLELNRGNLRQKHWQEVADAVNAHHGHVKKARRTDVQCKNRIDTLKKKYKSEKARVSESNNSYESQWPFFARLNTLIGSSYKPSPPVTAPHRKKPLTPPPALPPPPSSVPVGPRSKRPVTLSPAVVDESFFRRNFSAMAAAAAAAAEESETSRSKSSAGNGSLRRNGDEYGKEGYRRLVEAIEKFGEIYEQMEEAKQRQLIELEKQRMQFAKDIEIQRMKLFMDSQIQLEKITRAKRSSKTVGSLQSHEMRVAEMVTMRWKYCRTRKDK